MGAFHFRLPGFAAGAVIAGDETWLSDAWAVMVADAGTLGVLVCGTGIGMSIVANKHRGVRAALCTTEFEARMTRAHNDANVLCLGQRVVGAGVARGILEAFLSTAFEGGRHEKRVQKIRDVEAQQR